jgi:hypothetical protein
VGIIEEERLCSGHIGHNSNETPLESASFFVLASFLYERK